MLSVRTLLLEVGGQLVALAVLSCRGLPTAVSMVHCWSLRLDLCDTQAFPTASRGYWYCSRMAPWGTYLLLSTYELPNQEGAVLVLLSSVAS